MTKENTLNEKIKKALGAYIDRAAENQLTKADLENILSALQETVFFVPVKKTGRKQVEIAGIGVCCAAEIVKALPVYTDFVELALKYDMSVWAYEEWTIKEIEENSPYGHFVIDPEKYGDTFFFSVEEIERKLSK